MAKPAEATLGYVYLNRFAVCDCSDLLHSIEHNIDP